MDLLIPPPDFVRAARLSLNLSAAELDRLMGYSVGYVSHIEKENLPVTKKFARRFWAIVGDDEAKQTITAVAPLGVPDGVIILRAAVECSCGCKMWFIPNSGTHRYLDRRHRRRIGGWRGERSRADGRP